MRGKKLLTLGCVAGILAWGACFTPPPRIKVNLQGSRHISAQVANNSGSRHIDPAVLGPCIAHAINGDLRGKATAMVGGEPRPGDTVLDVTISEEEADPGPVYKTPNVTRWEFHVTLAAKLTRSQGTVLRTYAERRYSGVTSAETLSGPWDPAPLAKALPTAICERLANEIAYTEP